METFDPNDPEILRIEEEMDSTIEDICETERGKMKTFRMLNDERPTKHMIELEKKLGGYSSVSRINKPNPDYIPPEKGGSADEILNPKKFLLTDPKEVRKVMRDAMQEIYLKQEGVTPEQEHVMSFLRGQDDEKVIEELRKRKLTDEESALLEGKLSKAEMREQLFKHMKPASAPGQDGFTVRWIRHFWGELEDLCEASLNGCYDEMEFTTMLRTAIMKILRKGEKCPLETGNYRPISLLSVFYKIGSGCITRRLEKVMPKLIGVQQKAYSRERNIGSILLNLVNMMDYVNKKKMESLILLVDFKKAFDSINTNFIDSALSTFNIGPSFRRWVQLFFSGRKTYLLLHGYLGEAIELQQ